MIRTYRLTALRRKIILLTLALSLILTACQNISINAADTNTASPTALPPTATATKKSSPTSSPTPTPSPLRLFLSPDLPDKLFEGIPTPLGMVLTANLDDADVIVEIASGKQTYDLISHQVYALIAPFFTIQDDIALKDLNTWLTGSDDQEKAPFKAVYTNESLRLIKLLVDPTHPHRVNISAATSNDFSALPGSSWMILPFEELEPEFKVISIDGISPLDDDFDPTEYALSLPIGVRLSAEEPGITPEILNALLPESN